MLTVESLCSPPASAAIWSEWRQLMERVSPGQQLFGPLWAQVWSRTWGSRGTWTGRFQLISVRDDEGVLQGVLCIGRPKIGPFAVHSLGGHDVPWRGIVAASGFETRVGTAIGEFLSDRHWPLLKIGAVSRESVADSSMIDTLRSRNAFLRRLSSAQQITLRGPDSWDEYKSRVIGGKAFRKIGYYERRTQRAGLMQIRHFRQPDEVETRTMLDALQSVESASWMSTRASAVTRFQNPALVEFWEKMTNEFLSPCDHIDTWVMSLDRKPISFCLTLTSGDVRYVIANNYDEQAREFRTGSTLYRHMLQEGFERGIRTFEFGDGDAEYKGLWGATPGAFCDTWIVVPNRILAPIARLSNLPQRRVQSDLQKAACSDMQPSADLTDVNFPPVEETAQSWTPETVAEAIAAQEQQESVNIG